MRELARHVTEDEAQLADGRSYVRGSVGKAGDFSRPGAGGDLGVARELRQLPGCDLLAEKKRRRIGKLVGFVEDHRVARRQELRKPFVAEHHVGEEEMMVDDDDVGVERGLPRLKDEAVTMKRAVAAEAVVARRRDERPDRRILRDVGELAAISGFGGARERDDLWQVTRVVARWEAALVGRALEVVVADVIRASFQYCQRHGHFEGVADQRKVALEKLVLQRLGARRDNHLAAEEERRHQVGKCLAGARAGLREKRLPFGDRARDRIGHLELLRTESESRQRTGERAAFTEDGGEHRIGARGCGIRGSGERGVAQRFAFPRAAGGAGVVRSCTMTRIALMPAMRSANLS